MEQIATAHPRFFIDVLHYHPSVFVSEDDSINTKDSAGDEELTTKHNESSTDMKSLFALLYLPAHLTALEFQKRFLSNNRIIGSRLSLINSKYCPNAYSLCQREA